MATSAADVPGRFDLVISGGSLANPVGFVFLDALEPSLPFRTHRAIYSYTPTFIERANTSGNFGDNQQDFFLTSSQRDWSEGEQQRFYRQSDQDSVRRYWAGSNVDPVSIVGQVSLRSAVSSLTNSAAVGNIGAGPADASAWASTPNKVFLLGTTNIFKVVTGGTITDLGAHAVGARPIAFAADPNGEYFSVGGSNVRRLASGTGFTTFSATGADSLAFLNNTLYGYRASSGDLIRYDTAGAVTSLFTWKDATGTAASVAKAFLQPYGGKLLILRIGGSENAPQLWLYDGTAPAKIAEFPAHFFPNFLCVVAGTVFIAGAYQYSSTSSEPAIYFYANGTFDVLWRARKTTTLGPGGVAAFQNGLVFHDQTRNAIMFYDPANGGVSTLGGFTSTSATQIASADTFFVIWDQGALTTSGAIYPTSTNATSGSVTTSLFDFDSSLTKLLRGIKVDYDAASDGNGGSVDISYQVDSVDGAYTSLQTSAASGTEYTFSASGHTVSVKITLNKGTSTSGPILKRISVRAAPILTAFRMGEYVIDCTGDGGRSPRTLRDGTPNPLSGSESMAQLEIAKASTSPLTITDRRSTYTGFIETLEGYEEHPGIDDPTRSGEFVTKMITRGV